MSLKRRNARINDCSPPIDLDTPPSTCADLTIWFNELTLALHHGVAQWPECPRVKSLQTILNAWGRVRTPAGNVENVLKARRIREQIYYDVSSPEPPDDPMVLPLWHAIGLGRMAHDVATAETIDSAAARSIAASVRIAVAGVATRETAETDAFKRHHGIKDAGRMVRQAEDEVAPGPGEIAAQNDLLAYGLYCTPGFRIAPHHRVIADALMRVVRGATKRLIISLPPRSGKPVWEEEKILMWDGARIPLKHVRVGDVVVSGKGRPCEVRAVHVQGELPCRKIQTKSGRIVRMANDHPVWTPNGWQRADSLEIGDAVGILHTPETDGEDSREDWEFALAGYLIGDGCTRVYTYNDITSRIATFTNGDPLVVADFKKRAAEAKFGVSDYKKFAFGLTDKGNSPRDWIANNGLVGTSHTKQIPLWVMKASKSKIAIFLAAYFDCDGEVAANRGNLSFGSVNRTLLEDTQHLLLRFGIKSSLRRKKGRYNGVVHLSWRLSVQNQTDFGLFARNVPVKGNRAKRLSDHVLKLAEFRAPWVEDFVESNEQIESLPCRCLTVDRDESFTVQDIVVHNSFIVSQHFPAYYLGHHPGRKVMAFSVTADLAGDFGVKTRNLVASAEHTRVFPGCTLAEGDGGKTQFRTSEGGEYFALGIGTVASGRGAHLGIIDDAYNDPAQVASETYKRTLREWYAATFRTRIMPGGAVVVMHTRWAAEDLCGWLLDEHKRDGWEVISIPAVAEDDELWITSEGPWGRKKGEPLDPEWWREEMDDLLKYGKWKPQTTPSGQDPIKEYATFYYAQLAQTLGSRFFSALYQQRPTPGEGGKCKLGWFKRYKHRPGVSRTVVSIDTGQKGGAENDPTVIMVWGEFDGGHAVLDVWRERVIYPRLLPQVIDTISKWQPDAVLIEDQNNGATLLQDLGVMELANRVPLIGIQPRDSKVVRFDRITPLIESGRVWIPETDSATSWLGAFEEEVTSFPLGKHDDQIDALSQYLNWVRKEGMAFASSGQESFSDPAMTALLGRISGPWSKGGALAGAVGNGSLVFRRR